MAYLLRFSILRKLDQTPRWVVIAYGEWFAMWAWLSRPKNRKTLAFIGAAIAGLIALLLQTGVIASKNTAETPRSTSTTEQEASAAADGTVIQINGDKNAVQVDR